MSELTQSIKFLSIIAFVALTSCSKISTTGDSLNGSETPSIDDATTDASPTPPSNGCTKLNGESWKPNKNASADSISESNRDSISVTTLDAVGTVIGSSQKYFDQAQGIDKRVNVDFTIPEDLGEDGSFQIIAETLDISDKGIQPPDPMLVSLTLDNSSDNWIGLPTACNNGLSQCGSTTLPGAYNTFSQWKKHQINPFSYLSVNTFPTCNWTGTSTEPCPFKTRFLIQDSFKNRLPYNTTYHAKFALISNDSSKTTLPDGIKANIRVTILKKKMNQNNSGRTFDLNIVLVGSKNISASRTVEGKRNLDALLESFQKFYNQEGKFQINLGNVQSVEWGCAEGGDAMANIDSKSLAQLFSKGSVLQALKNKPNAINLYLISTISSSTTNGTILGVAGGIPGPSIPGTGSSGLVVSTFNALDLMNADCSKQDCPEYLQDDSFYRLGITLAHETGHLLGLSHPTDHIKRSTSSIPALEHDNVLDTPRCEKIDSQTSPYDKASPNTDTDPSKRINYITKRSCLVDTTCGSPCPGGFCPDVNACEFNHLMWWQSKSREDGNILSPNSAYVIKTSPFVR